jgi:hypothetical protein
VLASIVIWGWLFLDLHRIGRRLLIHFPPITNDDTLGDRFLETPAG